MRRVCLALCLLAGLPAPALAAFPYEHDPARAPSDLSGKLEWMYAATPEPGNEPVNSDPQELHGVRGASLVDKADVDYAWRTTTGRPDVTIAVLDSGIKWNDRTAMLDLRKKTRLWKPELPVPQADRTDATDAGADCSAYTAAYDANGDGVFNVIDYACDSRVSPDPALGVGPADLLDPQDVLIAFSDGTDADGNGFVDDIVGWDFLDDDNDPYDDVQYGHGTGEARDSTAEADNGGELGTCPNCMSIHMRVGDSFVADASDFGQAVLYAVDNDVLVIQEALGTLDNTRLARDSVTYAYRHGVAVIASAADEAAQHHNWPSNYPHTIVVNSVTRYNEFTPIPRSYLQFTGCTNFSSKITAAVPSVSCSSDATGRGSGQAGLIYSAALDAIEAGELDPHPSCERVGGEPCAVSANEVRQLMASGRVGGEQMADDVSFAAQPEPSCHPLPAPSCTDPNLNAPGRRAVVSPIATTKRYPSRNGHDQFYGYGRVNLNRSVDATAAGHVPPEVELTSPEWYDLVDPGRPSFELHGEVGGRGRYRCRVEVAPGSQPNDRRTDQVPPGDFMRVPSAWCDGSARSRAFDGVLAQVDIQALKRRFPVDAGDFRGREPGTGAQTQSGRPNTDVYGFTVRVIAESVDAPVAMQGEDRRNLYLHRDQDLLPGFPIQLPSDGESSPALADLDGDNENELVLATADGLVHAFRRDTPSGGTGGSELRGWPVRGDALPLHTGQPAFASGDLDAERYGGAILASTAVGDLDLDGHPEVVAADYEGKVYGWNAHGERVLEVRAEPDFSGRPLAPFVNERQGKRNRTQHGFLGSPVLASIDEDPEPEVIAAAMDRHLYAWNPDGSEVPGFPVLVVDPSKVASIDADSHQVRFNAAAGRELNQGAIVGTPAVGDITGDGKPEIVVGTNEEYDVNAPGEGGFNAGNVNTASMAALGQTGVLSFANGRLYAVRASGDPDPDPSPAGAFVTGWPVKIGRVFAELLPVVGEGITGSPVLGPVGCPQAGPGSEVGVMPDAGPAYVLNGQGSSCYGKDPTNGKDIALQSDVSAAPTHGDSPVLPAVGHPAFGDFGGGISLLAPAAGVIRALDLAVNEYQGGQDFLAAWDAATGQFRPNWPRTMNDLQFLTGPSVADIDGLPGEEALAASASLDLAAYGASGAPVSGAWPKLTGDWTVANPAIGSFGPADRKVVISVTRSGRLLAYGTRAPVCTPGSWPRFHHDLANSGDYSRDATAPGAPEAVRVEGSRLVFRAPGDDLLCGRAARYEVVTSSGEIHGRNFSDRTPVEGAPEPAEAGSVQSFELPPDVLSNVGIRAIDEQGNPGPVATTR